MQSRHPAPLHDLGKRVEPEGGDIGADLGVVRVQLLHLLGGVVIVLPARLQVELPAVTRDGHLHDLRGAFVDRRDPRVPADLLDHVLARVAVASERLDRGVTGRDARLGRQIFRDRALRVEAAFAGVDSFRGVLDVRARTFETHHVRDDQLVRVALLFGERTTGLDPLLRVLDRGSSAAQPPPRPNAATISRV